jgi:DNA polymerase/3'-5' exonuclease PolX
MIYDELVKKINNLEMRLKEAQEENLESARLLGMGGSRELRLMAKLEEAYRQIERITGVPRVQEKETKESVLDLPAFARK